MAKWLNLPTEPLRYQPDQMQFLESHRERICPTCQITFKINEHLTCPQCKSPGVRTWDRLTIIAGRRFGKSKIGSIVGTEEAMVPHSIGWACAPTNPKLHRYVIPAFQQLIPDHMVESWNSEFLDLRLKNGALIHFQTLEDPDQGRGQGLDWLWIDEACELTKAHWEVIRPSLAGDTLAFFTTSPRGYDWVYEELYHPAEENVPGYRAWHCRTADSANPKISVQFLEREKAQMSAQMYAQEYEADFVIFTGAVYGALVEPQVLRTDDAIKFVLPEWDGTLQSIAPWRQVLVGIDTGADHPFGAVKLVATEKGFIVVNEYLERDRLYIEHAASLKTMAANPNTRWAINKNERQQIPELAQHGIYCQKAENDHMAGTERVKTWLGHSQLWFIEKQCPKTIKQMKSYRYADNYSPKDQQKRKEKVFKFDDELPDCIRYALMTWPSLPTAPPKLAIPKRDLSKMPEEMAGAISRMRRVEAGKPANADFQQVDDFFA